MNRQFDVSKNLDSVRETDSKTEKQKQDGGEKQSMSDVLAKIAGLFGLPIDNFCSDKSEADAVDNKENAPIQNKIDGLAREKEVGDELKEKYPESQGYTIVSEAYLRDKDGNIVKDPETGQARRIDFVVVKDGKVIDSIEVTSKTADKTSQTAKEERIRDAGGNYIKDDNGNLVQIPSHVHTRIERRD